MEKLDLIQIGLAQKFFLTLRWYREANFGWRKLGKWRYALDISWLSLVFERYL